MQPDGGRFRAGERILAAVSGGADSVALLRWLAAEAPARGWVVGVCHFQHNLRGKESLGDEQFVRELAESLGLAFHRDEADTSAAGANRSLEEAARELRYGFFRRLLEERVADTIATAHTLDDQAETVLMKILRGAWTEGIGGIAPELRQTSETGRIVRPMLAISRGEVEAYLRALGQEWREDASNADVAFTRNRVRHEVLPQLRAVNPEVAVTLARMAEVARAEEEFWAGRVGALLQAMVLPGHAVRGGGRSVSTTTAESTLALDCENLLALDLAEQRRVLRAAAKQLGHALTFAETESLRGLLDRHAGSKTQFASGLRADRTARELRMETGAVPLAPPEPVICMPGQTAQAAEFGLAVTVPENGVPVTLRAWRAGDKVRLRHTLSETKVKEVLQRLGLTPAQKARWPVILAAGKIVWLRGVEVVKSGDSVTVAELEEPASGRI